MNIFASSFYLWLACLASIAFCDESNHFRGASTNEIVAFDDYQKSLSADDLAEALGVHHWNFQVQVPDDVEKFHLRLQLVQGKAERDLGYLSLMAREWDDQKGRSIPGVQQLQVLVIAIPTENATENPLIESRKLRIYAKGSKSGSNSSRLIDNPFRKGGAVTTFNTSRRVQARKIPPGVWHGFGTRFDLMSTVDDKSILRISFEVGEKSN